MPGYTDADTRLLKLANHIKSGKLYHDIFDMAVVHRPKRPLIPSRKTFTWCSPRPSKQGEHQKFVKPRDCNSAGCAIGELPKVFPEDWIFNGNDVIFTEAATAKFSETHPLRSSRYTLEDANLFRRVALFFELEHTSSLAHDVTDALFAAGQEERQYAAEELEWPGYIVSQDNSRKEIARAIVDYVNWQANKKEA